MVCILFVCERGSGLDRNWKKVVHIAWKVGVALCLISLAVDLEGPSQL